MTGQVVFFWFLWKRSDRIRSQRHQGGIYWRRGVYSASYGDERGVLTRNNRGNASGSTPAVTRELCRSSRQKWICVAFVQHGMSIFQFCVFQRFFFGSKSERCCAFENCFWTNCVVMWDQDVCLSYLSLCLEKMSQCPCGLTFEFLDKHNLVGPGGVCTAIDAHNQPCGRRLVDHPYAHGKNI